MNRKIPIGGETPPKSDRQKRLDAQLRANLKRRKAQARDRRATGAPEDNGSDGTERGETGGD